MAHAGFCFKHLVGPSGATCASRPRSPPRRREHIEQECARIGIVTSPCVPKSLAKTAHAPVWPGAPRPEDQHEASDWRIRSGPLQAPAHWAHPADARNMLKDAHELGLGEGETWRGREQELRRKIEGKYE
jgi:hypothetical protein